MVSFPPSKINLGLYVTERRPDGFHNIETCFYPVPWCDILEVIPSKEFTFSASGLPIDGNTDSNLCVRAYQLMRKNFNIGGVRMHLHKILPMGAGLGGGSSNAANTLVLLNEIFSLTLSTETLKQLASTLGSDCSFFIDAQPMMGFGRGEILRPISINLKGHWLVIVKPNVHVSTGVAYSLVKPAPSGLDLKHVLEAAPMDTWKNVLRNDFEEPVIERFPVIGAIKQELIEAGALYAAMSGSGSAVYGIFKSPTNFKSSFPNTAVWAGRL